MSGGKVKAVTSITTRVFQSIAHYWEHLLQYVAIFQFQAYFHGRLFCNSSDSARLEQFVAAAAAVFVHAVPICSENQVVRF